MLEFESELVGSFRTSSPNDVASVEWMIARISGASRAVRIPAIRSSR